MDPARFEQLLVSPQATIRETIAAIDAGAVEISLVVDGDRRLVGTVSDGDVRRALLGGASLDDSVSHVTHSRPVTAGVGATATTLLRLMTEHGIEQVPLLADDGVVMDLAFIRDLVSEPAADTPVVLMAGGQGLRLRPLTQETPKPMLPVGEDNQPLLKTTLDQLARSGFRKVFLSVNYRADVIERHFGDGRDLGLELVYIREPRALGSAGALQLARDQLTSPFIVMNGDLLTNVSLSALIRFHGEEENIVTVGIRRYELSVPFGVVQLDGTRVREMVEKPTTSFFVNAGIYAVSPEAADLLPRDLSVFNMTDLISAALACDQRVGSFPIREYWLDIGQLTDYERAHKDHTTHFRAK